MEEEKNGLYLEFIVHPGETIKEFLEENNMKQEELAIRTGFSPKHISEVINGIKGISTKLAKSLEYVFNVPTSFWLNLQSNYDEQIEKYKDENSIDESEIQIVKSNKKIIDYAKKLNLVNDVKTDVGLVIEMRKFCRVKDLFFIDVLQSKHAMAYRKSTKVSTNNYTLYIWLKICEELAKNVKIENEYNEEKLRQNISNIKKCMFLEINEALIKLKEIFSKCGIVIQIVENFKGVPIQGFIKKEKNKVILTMTIRGASADIFWFSLFHEIGHLVNKDIDSNFIDFEVDSDKEVEADNYAKDTLISKNDFENFYKIGDFSDKAIIEFAKAENVPPFIVVGRLNKEKNNYQIGNKLKIKYSWNNY
ncbi:MAG: HigA family addiction module antidote protein [Clostridia bacterium]|nr:HigA family addiction module antidote protein [Clostridia bacterium]